MHPTTADTTEQESKPTTSVEIVYTWPNGSEEVRYRRPQHSEDAKSLIREVLKMQARLDTMNEPCPYSYRFV